MEQDEGALTARLLGALGLADTSLPALPRLSERDLARFGAARVPPIAVIGQDLDEARASISVLAPQVTRSSWNLSRRLSHGALAASRPANEEAARRGVDLRCVVDDVGLDRDVVASMTEAELDHFRTGRVTQPMILLDRRAVVMDGPTGPSGERVTWLVSAPKAVELAVALFAASWRSAQRLTRASGASADFTPRQRAVMRLMRSGHSAAAIAQELGVAPRTVVYDVKAIGSMLGATGRVDLGYRIRLYEETHPES